MPNTRLTFHSVSGKTLGINRPSNKWENGPCPTVSGGDDVVVLTQMNQQLYTHIKKAVYTINTDLFCLQLKSNNFLTSIMCFPNQLHQIAQSTKKDFTQIINVEVTAASSKRET